MAARWTLVCVTCTVFLSVNSQTTQTMNGTQPSTSDASGESDQDILDKSMKPLYDLVKGFLGVVQPNKIADQQWLNLTDLLEGRVSPEVYQEWQNISSYMIGFAICFVVGILFCIIMPIVGCCFCCCRCCGKCGGRKKVHDPKRAKCKRTTYCTILLVLSTIMLAGVVCAFVSNQLIHSYLRNEDNQGPVGKIEAAFTGMQKYVNDTVGEVQDRALHAFDDTRNDLVMRINNTASGAVDRVADMLNASSLIQAASDLSTEVDKTRADLGDVGRHLGALQTKGTNLTDELADIKRIVTAECPGGCASIDINDYDTEANFTMLSDLSAEAQNVSQSLNMSQYISQANQTVQEVKGNATKQIQTEINSATSTLDNIRGNIQAQIGTFRNEIQNATKFATDASKTVNESMSGQIMEIFDYVWYGGIGVSSVYLLIVVCYFFGVLFGICGERPGYDAQCCNKGVGSNFLMAGVGFSFIFSWLLMLLIAFFFLIGGVFHTEICRYFDSHDPQQLQFVSRAVSDLMKKSYKADLDIVDILQNCKDNKPVYDVLKLEQYVNLSSLIDLSIVDQKIDDLGNVNFNLGTVSLISPELRQTIENFGNAGLDNINFTSFYEQMDKTLVKTDLRVLANQLRNASSQTNDPTKSALEAQADRLAALHDSAVVPMQADVENLRRSLQSLESHSSIQTRTTDLITGLDQAQTKFNADSSTLVKEMVVNLTQQLKDTTKQNVDSLIADVQNNVGKCRPLYDSVYGLTDALCVTMLNPFNTLWFAWGWCIFFFIPSIIFAVKLAGLYRREEEYTEKDFEDGNFSMYGGPSPDTIPLTRRRRIIAKNRRRNNRSNWS